VGCSRSWALGLGFRFQGFGLREGGGLKTKETTD
jgi:hypothetical protein